jgi:hypothetical protein
MTNDELKAKLIEILQESLTVDVAINSDIYGINPDQYVLTFKIDDQIITVAAIN